MLFVLTAMELATLNIINCRISLFAWFTSYTDCYLSTRSLWCFRYPADQRITAFEEKPKGDGGMINGGFFVLSPKVIDLIAGDQTIWEQEPLETLAKSNQLKAFQHEGYWQPMDTLRDKNHLEEIWKSGKAPWKMWS